MEKQALIEKERTRARWALAAVVAAVLLTVVGQGLEASIVADADNDAERLIERAPETGQAVAGSLIRGIGLILLISPLLLLFDAAAVRSEKDMRRFRLLVILGPIAFAISFVLVAIGLDQAAQEFVDGTPPLPTTDVSAKELFAGAGGEGPSAADDRAEDLAREQAAFGIGQGFAFAGLLAFVFGVVYSALQAMRVGLLTRFWGTLGMAFGAFLFIGAIGGNPLGLLGTVVFLLHVALVAGRRWFSPSPPAWGAGEAVPWPAPGEPAPPPPPEEPARPEDFGVEPEEEGEERERPGRRENRRKRKRRQRR